jgi:hypothetical protein
MSAYIVEKNHILYLVGAAISPAIAVFGKFGGHVLTVGDDESSAELGNLLWRENIKSISARYPHRSSGSLPGSSEKNFVIERADFPTRFKVFEPVQVIKAADAFEYHSSIHKEWKTSAAKEFISALRREARRALPGYEAAEWGAPKLTKKLKRKTL